MGAVWSVERLRGGALRSCDRCADTTRVRQLSPSSNLVVAVLAALGLLGTLSLPWFAAPAVDSVGTDGPVERGAYQVSHFFQTHAKGMVDGKDALGGARSVLFVLVAVVLVLTAAVSVAAVREQAENLLRLAALAGPVAVIAVAVAHPGATGPVHVHYGALVAFAVSLLMASAAWQGSSMRQRAKATSTVRFSSR